MPKLAIAKKTAYVDSKTELMENPNHHIQTFFFV